MLKNAKHFWHIETKEIEDFRGTKKSKISGVLENEVFHEFENFVFKQSKIFGVPEKQSFFKDIENMEVFSMNGIISLLKTLYHRNKLFFIIAILIIALFLVGCTSSGGSAPPSSSFIGGGCG